MSSPIPLLSMLETRVLGVLVEKQHTVPDSYPLTLNALLAGCNQKSSRSPVLEVTEADVQSTLEGLKRRSFVTETSGGRVFRYAHNIDGVLRIPSQSIALLAVLMLRGPQTAGELRIATERMHNFADISSVEAFLEELSARSAGALVVQSARTPGSRGVRWAHLLAGTPAESQAIVAVDVSDMAMDEVTVLKGRLARLESEVTGLKTSLAQIRAELGIEGGD